MKELTSFKASPKTGSLLREISPNLFVMFPLVLNETVIAITILTVNLIRWEQELTRILFFVFPAICEIDNFDGNNEVYRMAA